MEFLPEALTGGSAGMIVDMGIGSSAMIIGIVIQLVNVALLILLICGLVLFFKVMLKLNKALNIWFLATILIQ